LDSGGIALTLTEYSVIMNLNTTETTCQTMSSTRMYIDTGLSRQEIKIIIGGSCEFSVISSLLTAKASFLKMPTARHCVNI